MERLNSNQKKDEQETSKREVDQSFAIAILALGLSFLGMAFSRIPQLMGFFAAFYFYIVGMGIFVFYIMYSLRDNKNSLAELLDYVKNNWKPIIISLFIICVIFLIALAKLTPADSCKLYINLENNSSYNIARVGKIRQFNDKVTYNLKITHENVEYANLTIKFVSPLIFENGSETHFYYNASEPSDRISPESQTLTKAGAINYVYVFIYVTGKALPKEQKDGKIKIEITPE